MTITIKDFNQKRRNRAIAITNIAINKVPRTHLQGFTEEQNKFIQQKHMELLLLAQRLNALYNTNKMEVGILIDVHTWETWTIEGTECEVEMKKNPLALQNLTSGTPNSKMFMHNHPSTGTFSGEDFRTFCNNRTLYFITVIGNDGTVYILMKEHDFNASFALAEYNRLANYYLKQGHILNNGTLAMKYILKNAQRYHLIYKKGKHKV